MSLCRYLPTPSDRMAVMWTLLTVQDAVVLEYGPAGTTHYCVGLFSQMGISPEQNLFTTHMSEDDVIMGDVTRLEEAIVEVDQGYQPKVIFVIASAVTSVIGTDLKGVCRYMQDEVDAKLIAMENGGFRGDYTVGLRQAYQMLVRELAGPGQQKDPLSYNVLGASPSAFRVQSDLWEIENMMRDSFGFHPNSVLGANASLEDLGRLGAAGINLVLRAEALPAAEYLKEKFGTPYVYGVPYGCEGTAMWLEAIAQTIDHPVSEVVRKQIQQRREEARNFKMYASMYQRKPHKPSAAIMGDYDQLLGMAAMCRELNIQPTTMICPHTLKDIENPDPDVWHPAKEKEQIDRLRGLQYHFALVDDVSLHLLDQTNVGMCVSFPLVNHTQIATHLPLMGLRGFDYILETVDRYYLRLE